MAPTCLLLLALLHSFPAPIPILAQKSALSLLVSLVEIAVGHKNLQKYETSNRSMRWGQLIPIDNPQTPSRIQQHPHETRFPYEIVRTRIRSTVSSYRAAQWRYRRNLSIP